MKELKNQKDVEDLMGPESGSVVIDFWAPWCGPCKAMAPHFEAVAETLSGENIRFFKLNTESHPQLAAPFHIRALPTTLLIHNGEIMDVVVGAMNKARIEKKAQWLLSRARGEGFFDRLLGRKKESTAD
jgi:thioredoxin